MNKMDRVWTVAIYVFDEVEALDFAGPYEVFTTASRMRRRTNPNAADLFRVITVGRAKTKVLARAGLGIDPDYAFEAHPPIDVLVVPGGVVTSELAKPEVTGWIADVDRTTRITSSVCTGAFLLAKAGLLAGLTVTTHWEDIADLRAMFPGLTVVENRRWVDNGKVVTSAGISAGIDMCLHLVERLADRALAVRTARQMDFAWTENT
jgi:transcriptional regulator GlxA family with amidase domain